MRIFEFVLTRLLMTCAALASSSKLPETASAAPMHVTRRPLRFARKLDVFEIPGQIGQICKIPLSADSSCDLGRLVLQLQVSVHVSHHTGNLELVKVALFGEKERLPGQASRWENRAPSSLEEINIILSPKLSQPTTHSSTLLGLLSSRPSASLPTLVRSFCTKLVHNGTNWR